MNAANAIYGMMGSAGLFYILIALTIFLFQWPFSQSFMIRLLAWGIGLCVTIGLKSILTISCNKAQYRSFYRIRPHSANLSALALECWYIGLGGSVRRVYEHVYLTRLYRAFSSDCDLFSVTGVTRSRHTISVWSALLRRKD